MIDRNNDITEEVNKEELIDSDIEIVCEETVSNQSAVTSEDVDQIGNDLIFGKKQIKYQDGNSFISIIINAISVKINMPRGTAKALVACFAALLLMAVFYAINLMPSDNTTGDATENKVTEMTDVADYPHEDSTGSDPEGVIALKDYVNISPHYYYHLPDNVKEVWDPDEYYAENETFCDFTYEDNFYTIRSYVLDYRDEDLSNIIKADLSLFDNMSFIDEEYIEGRYGDILKIRFESTNEEGGPVVGTGYYWYESSPKICCLEISTDMWRDNGLEEMIRNSIYRVSAGTTTPYVVDEEAWSDIQEEEAMNSIAEDAMREYYEQKPDYTDRVLKP